MANTSYYFSISGSTGNSGLSPSVPIPLSKFGAISWQQGDKALFKKGDTFTGIFGLGYSGVSGNPIILDAYGSGHNPIIDAGGSTTPAFTTNNHKFITINNIEFRNSNSPNGIIYFVSSASDITIFNCYVHIGIRGINMVNCLGNLKVLGSYFQAIADPVVSGTAHPHGGGSHVQLNNCNGGGIEIANCRSFETSPNTGIGDLLSIYQCNGLSTDYILVHDNWARGGSTNSDGYCHIVLGDVGGSYQRGSNNLSVNPGKEAYQIQGGHDCYFDHCNSYSDGSNPVANVGIAFGNYSSQPCFNIDIANCKMNWHKAVGGTLNKWWDPSPKTYPAFQPPSWNTNTADSTGDATINNTLVPSPLWTGTPWDSTGLAFPAISPQTYGAADFDPGATSGSTITYSSNNSAVATIVAGKIHITGVGSAVITANDGSGSIPQSLTVNKTILTVTANDVSRNYGTANPSLTIGYSGFVYGETTANLGTIPTATTSAVTGSNAGTYSIVPSGGISSNYNFVYTNGTLTISKVTLSIIADNKTKTAGTANPTLTASYTGFVNGDTSINLTTQPTLSTTAVTGSPAGTYPITPSGAASTNYNISYVAGILTINAIALVFPSLSARNYGTADFQAGATGSNPISYISSNTAVATIIGSTIHITGAGSTVITASDGISSIPQTLVINKVNLSVIADNHLIVAGSSIPALGVQYNGFVAGDSNSSLTIQPIGTTSATSGSPAGTYSIVPSGGVSNNYNFVYTNGTLTIIPSGIILLHIPVILKS